MHLATATVIRQRLSNAVSHRHFTQCVAPFFPYLRATTSRHPDTLYNTTLAPPGPSSVIAKSPHLHVSCKANPARAATVSLVQRMPPCIRSSPASADKPRARSTCFPLETSRLPICTASTPIRLEQSRPPARLVPAATSRHPAMPKPLLITLASHTIRRGSFAAAPSQGPFQCAPGPSDPFAGARGRHP
jgi:hypothetical protein